MIDYSIGFIFHPQEDEYIDEFETWWNCRKAVERGRCHRMSKPYSVLREKMKPAARKKAAAKTRALLSVMPLQELRPASSG